jgi:MATE family multidrug resistance protein
MTLSTSGPALGLGAQIWLTFRLAAPVTVARAALLMLVSVDIAMSGHAGADQLAFYAIANSSQILLALIGIGLLQGTMILTSQAYGANEHHQCGVLWRIGMAHAALFGIVLAAISYAALPFYRLVGQSELIATGGAGTLAVFAWGIPGMLLFAVTTFFLEAINRPLPGMIVMIAANFVNVGLNWLFIYGHWGLPAMGAEGAAVATSIVRWLMFAALAGYVLWMRDAHRFNITGAMSGTWALGAKMRRLGWPVALSYGLESATFAAMIMLAGLFGVSALAGYQIAVNLLGLAFMSAIGIATAANVRVGNAVGRGDWAAAARIGWICAAMSTTLMITFAIPYFTAAEWLSRIYSTDPEVIALAVPLIGITGFLLLFDGLQGVLMGALRGAANVWVPTAIQLAAYWGIAFPLGYVLAFVVGIGVSGLIWGLTGGLFVAACLLAWRFHTISRRPIMRY